MTSWHLLVTRRIGVQVAQQWNHAFWRMKKPYGIGIDRIRVVSDGRKAEYFVDAGQWSAFERGMHQKIKDKAFVRAFAKKAQTFLERQSRAIRRLCQTDFSTYSDGSLQKRFIHVAKMADEYYTRMWMVFLINEPLAETVVKTLKKQIPRHANEYLLAFSSPLEPNDAIRERQGLLRIALQKDAGRKRTMLEKHARRFAHIPVFDFNHAPYTLTHFRDELAGIRNPQEELQAALRQFRKRRHTVRRYLVQMCLPEKSLEMAQIRMLSELAVLRDYRDTLRQKMNMAFRNLYGEIARRADMSIADVSLLSSDEIQMLLSKPETHAVLLKNARTRRGGFSLLETPERLQIKAKRTTLKKTRSRAARTLQGTAASPGVATGTARIILTNLDLPRIKDGDVMVAAMTRQDFVPYIRRCAAVVTDEGGVTCHAAIIARELGLPCVVGTKNATATIQNGQTVRVDGRTGLITKSTHLKSVRASRQS